MKLCRQTQGQRYPGFWTKVGSVMMLVMMTVTMLTGCGSKNSIDKSEFAKIMSKEEYKVEDQSQMIKEGQDFSVVYMARPKAAIEAEKKGEAGYSQQSQVEFYQFKDKKSCEETFDKLDDELVQAYKSAEKYETKSSSDSRWIRTGEIYYKISRVNDTMIIGVVPVAEEKTLNHIFDKLGY